MTEEEKRFVSHCLKEFVKAQTGDKK